jgi:hypothetical protein
MPVLERLGLVSATDAVAVIPGDVAQAPVPVRRYQLTDAGKAYFKPRGSATLGAAQPVHSDFCVAKLSLDKVVHVQMTPTEAQAQTAVVNYTYRVDAAPWTSDADAQRVFPMVARVVQGAQKAELVEAFTRTPAGWVANDQLAQPVSAEPVAKAAPAP